MRKTIIAALVCASFQTVSSPAEPLKLVSTSPAFWAVNVTPAARKTISLTFDQRLRGRFSDWIGLDALSPPSSLQTTFSEDKMSCSIAVQLEQGKVYVCGLNERGLPGVGFQNEKGLSLPPTYLVFQTAGTPAAEDTPPHVVKTMPSNGAASLDPTRLKSIAITFDAPMNPKKHGLHLFEDKQPVDISRSAFQYSPDGKTFSLAYDFKPSKTYMLELNNLHDIGFSRTTRVPLWPVQFTFSTGSPQ
jgi:Big-like domain-containing protein